jgi:charged multivesicular body protein 6
MLGGQISNQDEDEVEDELAALEAEVAGVPLPEVPPSEPLPNAPKSEPLSKVRAKARQREQEERVAMAA